MTDIEISQGSFSPGIAVLFEENRAWIEGPRVGLLAHRASVNHRGQHTAQLLREDPSIDLTCLFGPEHGYESAATAGEEVGSTAHPSWGIPVYSLYGPTRKPTEEMLSNVDVLVIDLQDLGIRCYTYVSTLRHALEAAAKHGKSVIVADRPIPFPNTIDGPILNPSFSSFVGCVPAPMVYGMTPAETALFLKKDLALDVDLKTAPMRNYDRSGLWPVEMPWVPPSPGIRTWETAYSYPATVFAEAFDQIDYGRGTDRIFGIIGIPGVKGNELCDALNNAFLPGVSFAPESYQVADGTAQGHTVTGIQISVTDPAVFQPVAAAVHLLYEIQRDRGADFLWHHDGTRPDFFDQLAGTDRLRRALQKGMEPKAIIEEWQNDLQAYAEKRADCLLY